MVPRHSRYALPTISAGFTTVDERTRVCIKCPARPSTWIGAAATGSGGLDGQVWDGMMEFWAFKMGIGSV